MTPISEAETPSERRATVSWVTSRASNVLLIREPAAVSNCVEIWSVLMNTTGALGESVRDSQQLGDEGPLHVESPVERDGWWLLW